MSPSQLLSLSSKPSLLRKFALRSSHTLGIRMFSSSSTTNPYLMCCASSRGEKSMTEIRMFDPAKEECFTVGDKPRPKELENTFLEVSSHGWGVYIGACSSILVSDFCNPSSSKSNPKMILLHNRPDRVGIQTEYVSGVAMSSSPEEEECVLCVKFTGRAVSLYRPGLGRENMKASLYVLPHQMFDHFEQSKLTYSNRDQKFYMPSSDGHHLWSCVARLDTTPQFHELRFHNLPQFSQSELQLLDSCCRTQHLVESPSGQRFLVKWYVKSPPEESLRFDRGGTKRFMVFREEEDMMNMCYTEDIGDLCIFLGNNEPFCLKASSFPGLNPNSIYFACEGYGEGYGVYNIATSTPRSFKPKSASEGFSHSPIPPQAHWLPHWLPPFPL